jgi:hypothetical protein
MCTTIGLRGSKWADSPRRETLRKARMNALAPSAAEVLSPTIADAITLTDVTKRFAVTAAASARLDLAAEDG